MVTRSRGLCGTCLVLDLFLLAIVCPCECSLKCNHMGPPRKGTGWGGLPTVPPISGTISVRVGGRLEIGTGGHRK